MVKKSGESGEIRKWRNFCQKWRNLFMIYPVGPGPQAAAHMNQQAISRPESSTLLKTLKIMIQLEIMTIIE